MFVDFARTEERGLFLMAVWKTTGYQFEVIHVGERWKGIFSKCPERCHGWIEGGN